MERRHTARCAARALLCGIVGVVCLPAVTLQQLTIDQVARVSTEVIRGQVTASYTALEGRTVFTHFRVQVSERWKGSSKAASDVAIPGGVFNGVRQTFAGVPALEIGKKYVLFLWTGPRGPTQLVGMHQGLFETSAAGDGEMMASRKASSELMLDAFARPVNDQAVRMRLSDLKSRVHRAGTGVAQ